jgi:hypothetical protein
MTAPEVRRWSMQAREATAERDQAIGAMREDGASLREIAEAAQLSHTAVAKILQRAKTTNP